LGRSPPPGSELSASRATHRARTAIPVVLTLCLLVILFLGTRPTFTLPDLANGDSADYVFGAASLLRDQYIVDWDGELPRVPKYAPGFPALLAPAVALGGIQSAIWVPYLGVFVLG
jgi:hypothetical protein